MLLTIASMLKYRSAAILPAQSHCFSRFMVRDKPEQMPGQFFWSARDEDFASALQNFHRTF
jgi:hypothetical protein